MLRVLWPAASPKGAVARLRPVTQKVCPFLVPFGVLAKLPGRVPAAATPKEQTVPAPRLPAETGSEGTDPYRKARTAQKRGLKSCLYCLWIEVAGLYTSRNAKQSRR